MLKKSLSSVLLFVLTIPAANAGLYFAPSAHYERIAAKNVTFEGVSPRWALGYDTNVSDSFNAGIELYADWPFALLNNHRSQPVPYLRPKYSFGFSVLPSIAFDDYVTGFARLGPVVTNFTDYDQRQKGFLVGLGMQYKLSMSTSLRGEYDYAQYQVLDTVGQPKSNQVSVGVVYNLDCWEQQCYS